MPTEARQLTATELMNVIGNAIRAQETCGFAVDCASLIGALTALLRVEEYNYLRACLKQGILK